MARAAYSEAGLRHLAVTAQKPDAMTRKRACSRGQDIRSWKDRMEERSRFPMGCNKR